MTTTEATVEVFMTAFRSLSKKGRSIFLQKLLENKELREDLVDIAIVEKRRKEPSRSLDAYLSSRNR